MPNGDYKIDGSFVNSRTDWRTHRVMSPVPRRVESLPGDNTRYVVKDVTKPPQFIVEGYLTDVSFSALASQVRSAADQMNDLNLHQVTIHDEVYENCDLKLFESVDHPDALGDVLAQRCRWTWEQLVG